MIQLTQDTIDWFKSIKYTSAEQMDAFHMCFTIGVYAVLKDKKISMLDYNEVQGWKPCFIPKGVPDEYKESFPTNIGLMLEAELERLTYDRNDKELLSKFLNTHLSTANNVQMTKIGANLMSAYSYKGFEILKAKMKKAPKQKTTFIKEFSHILKEYID